MDWTEYFITFGLLFAGYCVMRWEYVRTWHSLPPVPRDAPAMTGKGLNAEDLNNQVKNLRSEMNQGRAAFAHPPIVKQARRIEEKRQELARLSFFQPKPSPSEPTATDHTLGILLA